MKTHTGRLMLLAAMAVAMLLAGCAKKTPEDMLADADELIRQRNWLEAELKFEDLIERYPNNETAYYDGHLGLAMVYGAQNKFDEQRKVYDKMIKKEGGAAANNTAWMIYCRKLNSYVAEGKRAEALRETIETSATFQNKSPEAQMAFQGTLAGLYAANNQTTTALAVLDNLSRYGLKDPQQQFGVLESKRKLLETDKDWQKIVDATESYLKQFPDSPYAGTLLMQNGRYYQDNLHNEAKANEAFDAAAKAIAQVYEKAISADEKCDALVRLGGLYHIRGDYDKAEQYYNQLIKEFPINRLAVMAASGKVELALARHQPQKAIDLLTEMGRVYAELIDQRAIAARINQIKAQMGATTGTQTRLETAPTTGTAARLDRATTGTGAH